MRGGNEKEKERERKGDKLVVGKGGRKMWSKELCKDNMVEGGQWRIKLKNLEGFIVDTIQSSRHEMKYRIYTCLCQWPKCRTVNLPRSLNQSTRH